MPIVAIGLGALAAWGATSLGITTALTGIIGSEILAGVVVGALSGAVVGGLTAAITGGDIGESILYGAVGGAVVGGISGYLDSSSFSSLGSTTTTTNVQDFMVSGGDVFGSGVGTTATDIGTIALGSGSSAAAGLTSSDLLMYSGLSAGVQGLTGLLSETPYPNTKEAQEASIQAQKDLADKNNEASMAAAKLAAEQRQREAELTAQVSRESLAANQTTLDKELAQRETERLSALQEANLARDRMRETASGLTLQRKIAEGAAS